MNLSLSDLRSLLNSNPDIAIDDPYLHQPVIGLAMAVPVVKQSEYDFQKAVVDECDRRALTDPRYGLLFGIPNGQYRKGQRMEPGLRPGIPDLFLARYRHSRDGNPSYYGAFIELKVGDGKPSKEQLQWIERLRNQGYYVTVIWDSLSEVMRVLEWYINEGK